MLTALALAATVVAAPAPPAPAEAHVATGDTIEIALQNRGMHGSIGPEILRMEADAIDLLQWNTVILRRAGQPVAIFQSHQVMLAVNRSAGGERTFELIPMQGESVEFRADRMVPQPNNIVFFYTDDELVAVATQNGAAMVIDKSARVGAPRIPS